MQRISNTKVTRLVSYALLSGAVVLSTGCSSDTDEASSANKATTQQSAMDVKQPTVVEAPKPALQPAPKPAPLLAPKPAPAPVVEKQAEMAKEVAAAPNGEKIYATCVGCHGAKAEGGLGPRLNNQKPEDIVAKLKKYKAGEQMGPMTGMMAPMAAGLSEDDMKAIAEYVVTLK
ncbi:c-type cytochrome [Thiomicrorhabdus arctica]|uniref:c-type cytochrome n=1 Tax=Thiomicrorhabdus arctica TaxID=131540 RepID=UPI000377448C|nr:c-type cytochrome [Thiomicrorhabdus arctica]